jgi:hypothetical protein
MAKSAGKMALRMTREVSDAFPPLKSVATGLSLIVENVGVRDFLQLSPMIALHLYK